jgi:hypothetical protein
MSKALMLYFFMQSEHTLWPYGILALQKAHAAVFSLVLAIVSNKYGKGGIAIKPCYIGAIRILGRFGVL